MKKKEFLKKLKRCLSPLKSCEKQRIIDYYDEMIADRMENGVDEETAVSELGSPQSCAEKTLAEEGVDFDNSGKNDWLYRNDGSGKIKTLWIVLLVVGSPLWLGLLCGAFCVALGLLCGALGVTLGCIACCVAFVLGGPVAVVFGIITLFEDVACGLIAIGSGISTFALGCLASACIYKLTSFIVRKIARKKEKIK